MRFPLLVAFTVLAAAATAAPPDVPKTIPAESGEIVEIPLKVPTGTEIGYRIVGGKAAFRELKADAPDQRVFWFNAKKNGTYTVVWWTKGETASATTEIVVGPPAVDPVSPPPAPAPTPVSLAPIPASGLHVLIIFDPLTTSTLTESQRAVIYGQDVRDYLRAKCPKNELNGNRGWQIWPSNTDPSGAPKLWADAFGRTRASNNWIIVSNGVTGTEEKLPADPEAALSLLKKYGEK